jgi:hypothetical protein
MELPPINVRVLIFRTFLIPIRCHLQTFVNRENAKNIFIALHFSPAVSVLYFLIARRVISGRLKKREIFAKLLYSSFRAHGLSFLSSAGAKSGEFPRGVAQHV